MAAVGRPSVGCYPKLYFTHIRFQHPNGHMHLQMHASCGLLLPLLQRIQFDLGALGPVIIIGFGLPNHVWGCEGGGFGLSSVQGKSTTNKANNTSTVFCIFYWAQQEA